MTYVVDANSIFSESNCLQNCYENETSKKEKIFFYKESNDTDLQPKNIVSLKVEEFAVSAKLKNNDVVLLYYDIDAYKLIANKALKNFKTASFTQSEYLIRNTISNTSFDWRMQEGDELTDLILDDYFYDLRLTSLFTKNKEHYQISLYWSDRKVWKHIIDFYQSYEEIDH